MIEKQKHVCRALNNFEQFLIFVSAVSRCISISAFSSLAGTSIGITSSAVGLKVCALTTTIKNYKSIIMKKRKKHNEIVSLAKTKLNDIEVLIALYIRSDEFDS